MKVYETKDLRNIGIIGHGGCGKTTLVEAMAFNAGLIDRMGKVEDGSTVSDYDPEEVRRAISISSALVPLEFNNYKMNVMDTPGYFDFVGEMIATLRVVDSAVVVVDAVSGMEVGTEKAFKAVKDRDIPSIVMINKMDRENANFKRVLEQLREYFGNIVVPFLIPMGESETFKGIVNVVDMKAKVKKGQKCVDAELPQGMEEEISTYREMIIESVAQTSEELMEKYFDGEELTSEEIYQGLKQGVLEGDLIPVVCGSAAQNIGVESLMDVIINFYPAPHEGHKVHGNNPQNDKEVERSYKTDEPFSALVFKTIVDPYVGKLSLFKVMSGTLSPNGEIYNVTKDKKEKLSHLYVLSGKKQVEVEKLSAGDLGAFSKLQSTTTGDTLCDAEHPILYQAIDFPKPIISQAIVPKAKGDEDKIGMGLHRLMEEDPTFTIYRNRETKETLISGLGEMHLDIISKRLHNKFGVDVLLKDPRIPYRETIKSKATSEGKHKKQSGGRGQFGHIYVDFEPLFGEEEEFEFVDKVVGGAVPRQYIPAVEKGLRECLEEGILAKYPVTGVRCTLFDGSFHSVDSDEMSFKMAASLAFKKGIKEASPVLLEPIYHLEIVVPDEYMGDIMGDLNKKRGRILGMEPAEGYQKIIAEAPLSEMSKYATDLRSMTQARGEFMMEFARYEELPEQLAEKVIEEATIEE
ncbi:elongation factor G [Irregularibacter muris]|uniref:Elongation factor G n=1 Tax=Irregularibacter muris TaxID=1796619 RepID=A0AAE3HGN1_9FIRM|nr:elongation factor G [Irregularibacter muris]MCR1900306.1 elongation factor G [Irregularibacter muris]